MRKSIHSVGFTLGLTYLFCGCVARTAMAENHGQEPEAETEESRLAPPPPNPVNKLDSCQKLYRSVVPNFVALKAKLRSPLTGTNSQPTAHVANMLSSDQACSTKQNSTTQDVIVQAVSRHNGKVGLILPLHGPLGNAAQAIILGVRAHLTQAGLSADKLIIIRDSNGLAQDAEAALADLVLRDNVAMVIGGVSRAEAGALSKWADRLMMPMIMLSPIPQNKKPGRNVFHVFPNEFQMAENLAKQINSNRIKRLGILQPMRQKPSAFLDHLTATLKSYGTNIENSATYQPNQYESMEAAARKIFKIDPTERREEFEDLYKEAKKAAEKAKVPFDARLVSLPPKIEVDAILIPDNFRAVRYFIKIFKFLNVNRMPLIGTQEWRATGLIDPPEPFLDGAFFGDYVGSYARLPEGINVVTQGSPYFIAAEESNTIDFQIIGHQAMRIAQETLKTGEIRKRLLSRKMENLALKQSSFFKDGAAFDGNHAAIWPFFIFKVRKDAIDLVN